MLHWRSDNSLKKVQVLDITKILKIMNHCCCKSANFAIKRYCYRKKGFKKQSSGYSWLAGKYNSF